MILHNTNGNILVEEVVVYPDLGVGLEVIRHQHHRDVDVRELIHLQTEIMRVHQNKVYIK